MAKELKLVTLDENDFPVFNPEARMIKAFNSILTRDKGSKGDASGRFKKLATKELAYVHFSAYYNSEFITSYSEEERPIKLKKHLNLPDEWKPDGEIEYAIEVYKELTNTPSMDALREAREALFSADKILNIYRRRLEKMLQDMDMAITGDNEDENEKKVQARIDAVDKLYTKITQVSKSMPDALDTINKFEERIKKELAAELKGKKGLEVNTHQL